MSSSPSTSSHSNQPGYRRINRLPQPLLPATVPTTGTVARLSFFHARPSHKTRPRPQTPISASTGTAPSTSRERSTPDRATSMESLRCCAAGPEKEPLSDISSSSSVFLSSLTSGPVHRTHLAAQAQHASGSTIKSGGDQRPDCGRAGHAKKNFRMPPGFADSVLEVLEVDILWPRWVARIGVTRSTQARTPWVFGFFVNSYPALCRCQWVRQPPRPRARPRSPPPAYKPHCRRRKCSAAYRNKAAAASRRQRVDRSQRPRP